jgi:hypothetical protein
VERVLAIAHDLHQPLLVGQHSDGNDEATADLELVAQGLGNLRSARRYNDGIERRDLGPAQGAVAVADLDIAIAKPGEAAFGGFRQRAMPLDRVDLSGDAARHSGGVAGAGADLQHPVAGLHLGGLDHQRHDVRLRDRLPLGNGQRAVFVSKFLEARRDEGLARSLPHRIEDARIAHAAAGDLPLHHARAVDGKVIELGGLLCHAQKRPFRPANDLSAPMGSNVAVIR